MRNKYTLLSLLFLISAIFVAEPKTDAASANVTATLIHGSNQGNQVDPQLKAYASHLKRIFGVTSLKVQGRSSGKANLPGNTSLNLGGGHSVRLDMKDAGNGKIYIRASWHKGGQKQSETIIHNARRGQPSVVMKAGSLILMVIAN